MDEEQIKIMLVDDHQIVIDGINSLLDEQKKIKVVAHANNGKEALVLLENNVVDLVLIDVEMPILNGCETTAIITSKYPHIKVICLTTHDEKAIVSSMLKAGAKGYILKNTDRKTLLDAIDSVINGEIFYSSEIQIALATESSKFKIPVDDQNPTLASLTEREIEILIEIANGLSNKEIGIKFNISIRTVDTHRKNIMKKLDIQNVVALVKFALKSGLIY